MERCGLQMQHIEAVEQIEAKLLGHNALGEVAIGGGDQTNVDARGRVAADPLDFTTIEKSKQHGLHPGTRLADFVEKHGSAVCSREQPVAGSLSASELPRSCPNNSDSSRDSGIPAQLTAISCWPARTLCACTS